MTCCHFHWVYVNSGGQLFVRDRCSSLGSCHCTSSLLLPGPICVAYFLIHWPVAPRHLEVKTKTGRPKQGCVIWWLCFDYIFVLKPCDNPVRHSYWIWARNTSSKNVTRAQYNTKEVLLLCLMAAASEICIQFCICFQLYFFGPFFLKWL